MENKRQIRNMYYVDGSTVRKRESVAAPKRRPAEERPARRPQGNRTYRTAAVRAEKSLYFDKGYAIVLTASLILMIISSVVMLTIQSRVSEQERSIDEMQSTVQEMQANNAAYEDSLENMYSLNQIYDVATKDLGMVYSEKGQIVYYEGANEDYVKQLRDVPEAK